VFSTLFPGQHDDQGGANARQQLSIAAALREKDLANPPAYAVLDHYAWRNHCRGLFQMPIAA